MFVIAAAAQSPSDRRRQHRRHRHRAAERAARLERDRDARHCGDEPAAIDSTAQFAMVLILVTTLGVLTLCPAYFSGYRGHREELYLLLGVGTLGALTLACASHAATLLLGLELLSLPMVGAVAYAIDRPRSIEGGIKYLILSAGASATLLFGHRADLRGSRRARRRVAGRRNRRRGSRFAARDRRRRDAARGPRLQAVVRAVPSMDARRLRSRAAAGHRVSVDGRQTRRVHRCAAPAARRRQQRVAADRQRDRRTGACVDARRQRAGVSSDRI